MSTLTITTDRLSNADADGLWRDWTERGDAHARQRLVLSYAPMVRYLASRKLRQLPAHCSVDDLASAGLVALLESVDRFDPEKGASFEQFAWIRVSGALVDELRRKDWASRSVRQLGRQIARAQDVFVSRFGAMPTEDELARELGLTVEELRTALDEIERADVGSLNAPAGGSDDSLPLEVGDTLQAAAWTGREPEVSALGAERNAAMREAVAALDDRERRVLSLVHVDELPGAEIARLLGVSESRISQILSGIRGKLKLRLALYDGDCVAA